MQWKDDKLMTRMLLQIRPLDCGNLKWISNQHFNTFRKWLHEQPLLHLATGLRLPHRNVFQHRNQMGCNLGRSICWWCGKSLRVEKVWKNQLTSTKIWCYLPIHSTPFSKKPLLPVPLRLKQNALCKTAKQTTFWDWDPQTCCLKKSAVSVVDCKAWRTVFSSLGQTFMQVLIYLKPPRNKGRDPYWHWTS